MSDIRFFDELGEELRRAADHPPRRVRVRGSHEVRTNAGRLVPTVTVIGALAVAIAAIALLGHARSARQTAAARPPAVTRALLRRLAVLRRPQVARDLTLPPGAARTVMQDAGEARIVTSLTRLAAVAPVSASGAEQVSDVTAPRFFLVVTTPGRRRTGSEAGPRGAAVWLVGPGRGVDGGWAAQALSRAISAVPDSADGEIESIVPDGVAHVEWFFAEGPRSSTPISVPATVSGNVAYARTVTASGPRDAVAVAWYGSEGRLIRFFTRHHSGSPSLDAQALRIARKLAGGFESPVRLHPALYGKTYPSEGVTVLPPSSRARADARRAGVGTASEIVSRFMHANPIGSAQRPAASLHTVIDLHPIAPGIKPRVGYQAWVVIAHGPSVDLGGPLGGAPPRRIQNCQDVGIYDVQRHEWSEFLQSC